MSIVKTSKKGIDYVSEILEERKSVITKAWLWKINHKHSEKEDVRLKIGRYVKKIISGKLVPTYSDPKSELTLDDTEFENLLKFICDNYEPFKSGIKNYIAVDKDIDENEIDCLKSIFNNSHKTKLLNIIVNNNILPQDLLTAIENVKRMNSLKEFEDMLEEDLTEHKWQEWFEINKWILGSDYIKILNERDIDTKNIADYLMQAYDGFLDIVEIKRPNGSLKFWADNKDHNNYYPSSELTKAITQSLKYLYEVEREANSVKFLERIGYTKTVKPRCTLIFGRSNDWDDERKESYRILNASYSNLTILTYDHLLKRAKNILVK